MLAAAFSAFPVLRSEQEPYAAVPASASMHLAVPGFPSAIGVLLLLSCFEFIKEVKSEQFHSGTAHQLTARSFLGRFEKIASLEFSIQPLDAVKAIALS